MTKYQELNPTIKQLGCQQWLVASEAKRFIWRYLYGLIPPGTERIIDVGGGVSAMTCFLAEAYDYHLIELLAHDSEEIVRDIRERYEFELYQSDWYLAQPPNGDVVIAVDLFPNVDQRLAEFLAWSEKRAPSTILLLTFYPNSRSYLTKRVDADEFLTFRAWDATDLLHCISNHFGSTNCDEAISASLNADSLFANGRRCIAMIANSWVSA
jgi:hypothetical protein